MHFADSIVIFLLALVLFGPKKLPEIGRQIGKLLADFRRASNDFKMQIDEELRAMEQQERQKKLEEAAGSAQRPELPAPQAPTPDPAVEPSILPPAASSLTISPPTTGETVSASAPFAPVTPPELPESTSEASAVSNPEATLETPTLEVHSNGHGEITDAVAVNGAEPRNEHAPVHHG
ncbi:MAG TPA: twin-arginine translocase TatA/TatE family subunit [Silvibacterium sp.]|nr:twin-arginine translocase TatA/TatE family subunit [Silvibacterium sp.]